MLELQSSFAIDTEAPNRATDQRYTHRCSMKERKQIDIRGCSFDEFVSFIFDREIRAHAGEDHPWYFEVEVAFDPNRLCEFYIRLFRGPDSVLGKYSKAQLETGFWAIHGGAFDGSVQHLIWNLDVPFLSRCECVKSMSD